MKDSASFYVSAYFDSEMTAPDREGATLEVTNDKGHKIGFIKCINVAPLRQEARLLWFGGSAFGNVTGDAKSRESAAYDVLRWACNLAPDYVKHGIKQTVK